MTYKLRLENANENFLKEIRELAKKSNVKLRLLNPNRKTTIKEFKEWVKERNPEKMPTDRLRKALYESENILEHPNEYKSYRSISDLKRNLES
ncbi:hypothetical protein DCO58_07860 [Helicobacter saguini]|uniref:Uncharacterized protein n=1 Tax=Helicobacter saguini TaxID=1548018 RepID=A0A347VNI3_9HELI|nr:hypothetical protein [Helicobacter saguini]MWV61756.1 hypothetical protein [Helicobacter saguini]MWV67571.1 hypothetical protein [Helicobacter saguini]MWV69922.1 hypothetical protein [Helicobacter saguini]MWV72863.1 hypothetical protein [Helicobacter saguini]TLD91479.1 hypothetical protein LS64_011920 [Helicobacter saguini]